MRKATPFLVKFVLTLALLVAALPLQASGMPCATPKGAPVAVAKPNCAMPCCRSKTMVCGMAKDVACQVLAPVSGHGHALTKVPAGCPCEIGSLPSLPATTEKTAFTYVQPVLTAILPASLPEVPISTRIAEPGIFGVDSGPPSDLSLRRDSGRAPPVARA